MLEVTYPVDEKKYRALPGPISRTTNCTSLFAFGCTGCRGPATKSPNSSEEYTYLDLKINNGYTDADFDPKNRQYKFP